MDFNIVDNLKYCGDIVEGVKTLLFYTHIPTAFIAFLIGLFIFIKKKDSLLSRIFFVLTVTFFAWVVCNILIWLNYAQSSYVMTAWAPIEIFSVGIFILCLYFTYVFLKKKDAPFWSKCVAAILFLPVILSVSSQWNLQYYDLRECVAIEWSPLQNYILGLKIFLSLVVIVLGMYQFFKTEGHERTKVGLLNLGIITFLASFLLAGMYSEQTGNYAIEMYGLLGMLVFVGLLAYLIVKFHAFNVKLLGAEMLVVTLIITVLSQYIFVQNTTGKILVVISGAISIIFGHFLTQSVQQEVSIREKLERLTGDLKKANNHLLELDKQKSEFVSFATHQLKSPLAAMRGYASLILDGDYGEISAVAREPLSRIFESTKTLANVVEGYLNISRIELGTMKYDFAPHDIRAMVSDVIAELEPNTKKAGITLKFNVSTEDEFIVNTDPDKLKQVFANLIDNSVKYTPTGSVTVSLEKKYDAIKGNILLFSVKDTGIGMSEKTIASLFQKFTRAYNANKTNIHGTGLGLFVAKEIVTAHKGRVWAESEGEGKGSQFYVELPSVK